MRSRIISICFIAILLGCVLRFYGLQTREGTSDEGHYRGDMFEAGGQLRNFSFRNHSVNHRKGAPHGMLGPIFSFFVGKCSYIYFKSIYPKNSVAIQNLFSRLGYAICGTVSLVLFYLLAVQFFSPTVSVALTGVAALHPLLILWSRTEYLDGPMALFILASLVFLFRSHHASSTKGQIIGRLVSGICLGLAVGTKWSALYLAPFWFLYLPLFHRKINRELCLGLVALAVGFTAATLFSHSTDSIRFVLSINRSNSTYDAEVNSSTWEKFLMGIEAIFHWNTLYAFLELHGILLISGFFSSVVLLVRGKSGLEKQKTFSLSFFLAVVVLFSLLCACAYSEWRTTLFAYFEILVFGILLQRFSSRRFFSVVCWLYLAILPFSVVYGLRLKKPRTYYHGVGLLYGMPLGETEWSP